MTTASSFPFSTMEIPLLDDTMEMASPYHGHADDFDIDLDVMEDQVSNPDKDMTPVDYFPGNAHGQNYNQDGPNDADMMDDIAEPLMTDADEQFPEATHNIEMQYEDERTYEQEMIEDEYDEDIDAPVPEPKEEAPISLEQTDNQGAPSPVPTQRDETPKKEERDLTESHPERIGAENLDGQEVGPQHSYEQGDDQRDEHTPEEPEISPTGPEPSGSVVGNNGADQVYLEATLHADHHEEVKKVEELENGEEDLGQEQLYVDGTKVLEIEQQTETDHYESDHADIRHEDTEREKEHTRLYPVKVYYQETEISLFPPCEGDSSETFFLEDERLAYGSFEKLFEACRGVLQDHVSDNEVLVMDIEALNIQLTEDSIHIRKVTLHDIVELYLLLCHNDGIEEPEALYITLSTKLTIFSEVSELLAAANEGKRLSEIHQWEIYNEGEDVSTELVSAELEGSAEGLDLEENQDPSIYESEQRAAKSESSIPDQAVTQEQVDETRSPEVQQGESPKSRTSVLEGATSNEGDIRVTEAKVQSPNYESPDDGSYVSEEQGTESTATIEELPPTKLAEEQGEEEEEEDADRYYDDANHVYNEVTELGDEARSSHPEEETNLDKTVEYFENQEETHSFNAEEGAEIRPGDHDLSSDYREQTNVSTNHVPNKNEDITEDTLDADDDARNQKLSLEEGKSPALKSQLPPKVVDDSLDITDDLVNSPSTELKSVDREPSLQHGIEPGEIDEQTVADEHSPLFPIENNGEDLGFEEGEYLDLGITDGLGEYDEETDDIPSGPVSTKRSRDPDDEFEVPEITTPDAKRSRSS